MNEKKGEQNKEGKKVAFNLEPKNRTRRNSSETFRSTTRMPTFYTGSLRQSMNVPNTHQLGPRNKFSPERVLEILERVMEVIQQEMEEYDPEQAKKLASRAAALVREEVNRLKFDRCRICVNVIIGEEKHQGYAISFRPLWDLERESYQHKLVKTRTYFAYAVCFGVYAD